MIRSAVSGLSLRSSVSSAMHPLGSRYEMAISDVLLLCQQMVVVSNHVVGSQDSQVSFGRRLHALHVSAFPVVQFHFCRSITEREPELLTDTVSFSIGLQHVAG